MPNHKLRGMRRKSFSPWVRYPSLVLLYGLLVPLVKLLQKSGLSRRMMQRRRRARQGFGDYAPTAHDVFACVYFKSGTNWLMQILLQVIYRGAAEFEHVHDLAPWPDSPIRSYAVPLSDQEAWMSSPTGLRVIKTHEECPSVPYSSQARYICVVRDPKDVCVSAYHFMRASGGGPLIPPVPRFVDLFLSPSFPFYPWAEFLNGYWRLRERENVLFLTYDEMKKDLRGTVVRIANLLNVALSEEELDAVVKHSSFDYMKTIEQKFETGMVVPWAKPHGAMIRRGERKSAGELLTPELQRKIDDHCRSELRRLGCDFPYDEAFA
jgi:hypothetical protein